ncbi:hypothetical protein L1889_09985 [Paenalcaligenes niemegkensis]|uniref:AAA family ATPase n=1 Tax=Paenalcaligenes niemegkensis TaxID=2895469 RepID=UPI001EE7E86D|nr:hypothetical protein [Paenalcaligenes niemegkensis]MCQ9616989.1 hypothetical protein [Paenalcaligenes niemegkensis]
MPNDWKFLLCGSDAATAARLSDVCSELGSLQVGTAATPEVLSTLEQSGADLVFFDFGACGSGCAQCDAAVELTQAVAQNAPQLGRIAIGASEDSKSVIRALRAGVHEFVDLSRPAEVLETLSRVLRDQASRAQLVAQPKKGRSALIMGARPGVGATTAAVHVAAHLQKQLLINAAHCAESTMTDDHSRLPLEHRVCLVDLGWPTGDSNYYLNLASDFSFIDASKQVHRLDGTLLKTALPQHPCGMSTITLPTDPGAIQGASLKDCLQLCAVLAQHFGALVIETNGFPNQGFLRQLADQVDERWLVCDQNVASLISVADSLAAFEDLPLQLVINRYDIRAGLPANEIAERFKLNLLATLPDRGWEMLKAMNLAELISGGNERDPYIKAISAMATTLAPVSGLMPASNKIKLKWLARLANRSR